MSTPAGWYPDPTGRHQNRWFDGTDWTDQVADGQAVSVDPVHGGAKGAAAGATQAISVNPSQPGPPPGAPGTSGAAPGQPGTPAPGVVSSPGTPPGPGGTPPPGAPLGAYTGPPASSSGGKNKTLLIVAAVVVVVLVAVGLVVALGGGDDGGDTASSSAPAEEDQSDEPEEEDEDPTVSDLFDDMADEGDTGGTPSTTVPEGEYPQSVIDTFTDSCTSAGSPASFCGCVIDELQATVPYDRFVEIDAQLAENPDDIPSELTDAAASCQ